MKLQKLISTALLTLAAAVLPAAHAAKADARLAKAAEKTEAKATAGREVTKSFNELGTPREPLRLNTWQASYTVKLPLSPREIVTDALLRLDTVNSTALIRSRSELSVRVNGRILAQYALDPERTRMSNELILPMELLKPGYNDVEVAVVQHYTYDCEDPSSPELWTEIDPLRSSITVNYQGVRPNLQPRLTQLHTAFDRRAWVPRRLAFIVGTETLSEIQLAAAGTVVQGLALRKGYQPLSIDVYNAHTAVALRAGEGRFGKMNPALVEGRDLLLVGKKAELNRYFDVETNSVIGGPFVGVFAANQGDTVIVVVSGTTDEELMQAARSVADPSFKYSDVPMELVTKAFSFPQKAIATPKKPVPFHAFDFQTTSSRGIKIQPVSLEFRAPADFGARKGDIAQLKLHFSYGAGLRKDSSMKLSLNGNFAVAVPLNEPTGGEFTRYEVSLPAQFIRPGYNTLTFEPVFLSHKDRCDMLRDEHMVLTIYEDSTVELPGATVLPSVPDLERFSHGLWPLDEKLRVYMTANDVHTAAATLEFLAMVAQKNRAPMDLQLSFAPLQDGHMLVVGPYGGMAQYVADALPLRKYAWTAEGEHAGILQGAEGKRVITALLARDAQTLKAAVDALGEKGLWNGLKGAAAVIDTQETQLKTEPAGEKTEFGVRQQLAVNFTDWRWMAAALAGLTALFTLTFVAYLRRRASQRNRSQPAEE